MSRGSGRVRPAGSGWRAMRRGSVRAVCLLVLALGALAFGSCVAQATSVTDFSTFQSGGPSVPTMGWPFGLSVTYSNQLWALDHGEIYEETGGTRVTLTNSCHYSSCVIGVQPVASRDYAHPPTRTFEFVFYTDRNVPYGNTTLVVNERRLHFALDGDDNVLQGSRYGAFVTSCGLRTGTPQEGANAIGGTAFLVVPIPSRLGIPSTWLCNRG